MSTHLYLVFEFCDMIHLYKSLDSKGRHETLNAHNTWVSVQKYINWFYIHIGNCFATTNYCIKFIQSITKHNRECTLHMIYHLLYSDNQPRFFFTFAGGRHNIIMHTYTYIHTYIHTYMHACMHAYIHTYVHTCIHTYVHSAYIHTYILTYTHTYIHAYILTYIHTYIHTYVHTYVRTYIRT